MKHVLLIIGAVGLGVFASSCSQTSHPEAASTTHMHQDVPPHGGLPVPLGDDYNLELVHDPASGTLTAYVLDDEMEEFVRISDASVTLTAAWGGRSQSLTLAAVANPATGETVGDTSMFEGQADWLKGPVKGEGTVERITVHGTPFVGVKFQFKEGHEGD